MSRHRREESISLTRPLALLLAVVLVAALAVYGLVQALSGGDDDAASGRDEVSGADGAGSDDSSSTEAGSAGEGSAGEGTAGSDDCQETHEVSVLATPDIAPVVSQVAQSADPCTDYTVTATEPTDVVTSLTGGQTPQAQVWIPNAPAFAEAAADAGVELQTGPVIATAPVVLAAAESVVSDVTAHLADEPTWADLVTAELPLVVADPGQDPATLVTLLAAQSGLGDSSAARVLTESLLVDLAQNATADPLAAVGNGLPVFVPATSAQVAASADTEVPLAAITPRGGVGSLSYPFLVLGGDTPGVDELREALLDPEASAIFEASGFTAGDDEAAPPDEAAAAALTEQWGALNPPSRLLAVIDVSGSMDEVVGDTTRIGITSQAAGVGLGMFPDDSAVGLWAFSTNRGPAGEDYAEILPVRPLTADVDGQTQRELLEQASAGLDEDYTTGDTGLHDTILAAYRHMQQDWEAGYVSSIVLLTDGVNDDSTGGLSEEELIVELEAAADPAREVRLILIGMGPDVDSAALDRVASAVGGQSFTAEDPRDIGQVFVQAIAARHG